MKIKSGRKQKMSVIRGIASGANCILHKQKQEEKANEATSFERGFNAKQVQRGVYLQMRRQLICNMHITALSNAINYWETSACVHRGEY